MSAVRAQPKAPRPTDPLSFAILYSAYTHVVDGQVAFPQVVPITIVCSFGAGNKAPAAIVGYGSINVSPIPIARSNR